MVETFGWRSAFFIIGVPGVIILGPCALRLPRLPSGPSHEHMTIHELLRVPAFLALLLSGWFSSFAGYAYVAWGPAFVQGYRGFSARQAGLALGSTLVVGGTSGITAGAYLSDLLAKIRSWGRPIIILVGFVLGAPAIYLALHSAGTLQFLFYFGLGAFFLSCYHGPLTATIHDFVPPHGRATALGLYYFLNLFAMAVAPLIVGWIADHSNLITAFSVPITSQLVGAAFFVLVIQSIRRNGLHHPALARHWCEEPCRVFPHAIAAGVGASNV